MRDDTPTTLEELLEQHPWPADFLAVGRPLEFFWHYRIDAPLAHLWPHVADSSRMNRVLGLDAMDFEELPDGTVRGSASHGGVHHVWTEVPWEWIAQRELKALRLYDRGFAHLVRAIFRFAPTADGTTSVAVYFGWIPRGFFSRQLLALGFRGGEERYGRFFREVASEVADRPQEQLALTHESGPALDPQGRAQLQAGVDKLIDGGHREALVRRLQHLIAEGDPLDLARIHAPVYARRWDVPLRELLSLFLHATRAGMLNLTWDVMCPYCRGLREELQQLADLKLSSHCEVCAESFSTSHPNVIEISFRVSPSVRDVPQVLYCSAEPSKKQHIVVQRSIPARTSAILAPPVTLGEYRVRLRGQGEGVRLIVESGAKDELTLQADSLRRDADDGANSGQVRAGEGLSLTVVNGSDEEAIFVMEHSTWSSEVLRPQQILAFQDFRDLFSHEYLSEGLQLAVGVQTLLFTDMVGSTAFYQTHGDADAYVEVHRHFNLIKEIVGRHDGAMVKTIGDAVMAVFPSAVDGLRAAEGIHRAFGPDHPAGLRLRVSLHVGPVIAAPYNGGLDFFGGTVNVAAKLQSCASAGEVAMSMEVLEDQAVAAYLGGRELGESTLHLKGFAQERQVRLWKVSPSGEADTIETAQAPVS